MASARQSRTSGSSSLCARSNSAAFVSRRTGHLVRQGSSQQKVILTLKTSQEMSRNVATARVAPSTSHHYSNREFRRTITITAENGKEGLELLSKIRRPGMILLDLMMPIMDGWEFVERLNTDANLATIPVVLMNSYAHRTQGMPTKDIHRKPVDLDTLSDLVRRYCGGAGKPTAGAA